MARGIFTGGIRAAQSKSLKHNEGWADYEAQVKKAEKDYKKMQDKKSGWQSAFSIASLLMPLALGPLASASGLAGLLGGKLSSLLGKKAMGSLATSTIGKLLTKPVAKLAIKTAIDTAGQQYGRGKIAEYTQAKYKPEKISISKSFQDVKGLDKASKDINKEMRESLEIKPWEGFKESFLTSFALQGGMEALKKARGLGAEISNVADKSVSETAMSKIGEGASTLGEGLRDKFPIAIPGTAEETALKNIKMGDTSMPSFTTDVNPFAQRGAEFVQSRATGPGNFQLSPFPSAPLSYGGSIGDVLAEDLLASLTTRRRG